MPDDHDNTVAANIRAEMARASYTQSDLADAIGLTQQALSRRLRAVTPFTASELARIAKILDVPAAALLNGDAA